MYAENLWFVHSGIRNQNTERSASVQLNAALSISGFDLPLPPKKIIGNMEPDFIAQRQIALQVHPNTTCSLLCAAFVRYNK